MNAPLASILVMRSLRGNLDGFKMLLGVIITTNNIIQNKVRYF